MKRARTNKTVLMVATATGLAWSSLSSAQTIEVYPESYCNYSCTSASDCEDGGNIACTGGTCDRCPDSSLNEDWSTVFVEMMDSDECAPDTASDRETCTVRLSCNADYRMESTLNVCRSIRFVGCANNGGTVGTSDLIFDGGITGVRAYYSNQCPRTTKDHIINNVGFENLTIRSEDGPSNWGNGSIGMHMNSRPFMKNVLVSYFDKGIYLDSSVAGANNNNWNIENVRVQWTGDYGFYAAGGDSQAGIATNLDVSLACRDQSVAFVSDNPSRGTAPCFGIGDATTVGNTYVSPHTTDVFTLNGTNDFTYYPSYYFTGVSNASIVVGPYDESQVINGGDDFVYSEFPNNTIVVGGGVASHPASLAFQLSAKSDGQFKVRLNEDDRTLSMNLGNKDACFEATCSSPTTSSPLMSFSYEATGQSKQGYNLAYDIKRDAWSYNHSTSVNVAPIKLTTTHTINNNSADLLSGHAWMDDFYVGGVVFQSWNGAGPDNQLPTTSSNPNIADIPPGSRYQVTDAETTGDTAEYILACVSGTRSANNNDCSGGGTKEWRALYTVP